ncbi:MAG: hypothetical protein JWO05_2700 [Gemmatimonadetes bacterium]|nr:hypothetical protein [Gemmatimonadota bacterium]
MPGSASTAGAAPVSLDQVRRVAVGSGNRVKVGAARAVIARVAPHAEFTSHEVRSGVPDQPVGDAETIRGALARAHAARVAGDADIGVGIEGGVVNEPDGSMRTCAWAALVSRDGRESVGGSLAMPLPPGVAELIRGGMELGHAMDQLTGAHDTKRGVGAVGTLTAGMMDRQGAYEVLVTYALAKFVAADWWAPMTR